MLTLAIDTTAVTASSALVDENGIIAVFNVNNKLTHSEKLMPMIDAVLHQSGFDVSDIELVCVSAGPGSFTGVRIGISAVKGLAFSRDLPCVPVSSLEALAYMNRESNAVLCPLMDARRDEYYNALFAPDLSRICDDRAVSAKELEEQLKTYEKVILNGDGATKYFMWLDGRLNNVSLASEFTLLQNAASVGMCGLEKYKKGKVISSFELAPVYLRKPQAEREYIENNK
ncbi:MAG: tRNA (adenosine(37)-N6)-threonylcarbamoyltransferase complex dimerization subunit type 1 TsaB [Clostridia bacterium]|nr:tRNA (adenosine(37)-N6)-threonylcarbamoyltransferase complex dimerization subunit type 1 TsaB [Clostridia bacterium]